MFLKHKNAGLCLGSQDEKPSSDLNVQILNAIKHFYLLENLIPWRNIAALGIYANCNCICKPTEQNQTPQNNF